MNYFPNSEFVWNEDCFDSWIGKITIAPKGNQTLLQVNFEDAEEIKLFIPTDSFKFGFAEFLDRFKETAESFWEMSFHLI